MPQQRGNEEIKRIAEKIKTKIVSNKIPVGMFSAVC